MLPTQATWSQFLLSPSGRFNRARYWGATFLVYGAMIAYAMPALLVDTPQSTFADTHSTLVTLYFIVGAALFFAVAWVHICTTVKRFHDRDKAWPWVFIGLAPYIGGLWIFIECGCMAGTRGRNRYGADPLNPLEIADVFDGPASVASLDGAAAGEPRLAPGFGVTPADRLG